MQEKWIRPLSPPRPPFFFGDFALVDEGFYFSSGESVSAHVYFCVSLQVGIVEAFVIAFSSIRFEFDKTSPQ
jgi:hypothetical protein